MRVSEGIDWNLLIRFSDDPGEKSEIKSDHSHQKNFKTCDAIVTGNRRQGGVGIQQCYKIHMAASFIDHN